MGDLKPGWKRYRFGEMVLSMGATRKARGWTASGSGVNRYVGLEHLDSKSLKIQRWGSPDDVGENSDLRHFEPGDVILARRGIELRKVGVAEFRGVASGHALVFRAKPEVVLPEFLPFFMQSDAFMLRAERFSVGSLSRTVNLSALIREEFALPPLEEQRRLLPTLVGAEEARRAADYLAGSARIAFHSTIEHAHAETAARFPLVALEGAVEAGRPITYGILMPGTGFPGGVPVIKVKDFPDGEILRTDLLLTDPAIEQEYRRSRLRGGDVLVSIRGTIGRVAVVPLELAGANITQDAARLSFPPSSNPSYFRGLLECATLQRRIHSNVPPPAPAGMPRSKAKPRDRIQGLNIGELRRVVVPVPPRQVQDSFAETFDTARASVTASAKRAEDAQRLTTMLVNRLLGGGA
ncbi:hypothetical protein WME90_06435 [Sorangium sp. So ce375]|uniref:hypothetical protein n=1 Tax=Sorangium sp. So ce375 TaxID=3133306 RepID=UPI003F5B9CBF